MNPLDAADNCFKIRLQIVAGGSGAFMGIIDEPDQKAPPGYIFTAPRRNLRVDPGVPVQPGTVIRTPGGLLFMLQALGPSEQMGGTFKSFRLFQATHYLPWQRRIETIDTVTQMNKDGGLASLGMIYCSYEPEQKQQLDRTLHTSFETALVLTTSPLQRDDLVNGYKVDRADNMGALWVCTVG